LDNIARELVAVARELVSVDKEVKAISYLVDVFATDEYGDEGAADLMHDIKGKRTVVDIIRQLKLWGVSRQEFKTLLDDYVKDESKLSEWKDVRKDMEKAF